MGFEPMAAPTKDVLLIKVATILKRRTALIFQPVVKAVLRLKNCCDLDPEEYVFGWFGHGFDSRFPFADIC